MRRSWCRRWLSHNSSGRLPLFSARQPRSLARTTMLGYRGACVWTTCLMLLNKSWTARTRTRDLLFSSPSPYLIQHQAKPLANYTVSQKTVSFYFCNNFVKSFFLFEYWYTYTTINVKQNDIKIINLLWTVFLYCLMICRVRIPTLVLSHKLKRHHYCLENVNKTSYKVSKCMD